jgi:small neutral amino acid transporter SnatA (MarC family)
MLVIGIISIVIYVIAVIMVYTNTYELKKEGKLKFTIIGIIAILIITWIIVLISSNGINVENENLIKITKRTSVLLFAPINTIFILPYLGNLLNRYQQKSLTDKKLKKRAIIFAVIILFIIIMEISYIKDFEIGLLNSVIS